MIQVAVNVIDRNGGATVHAVTVTYPGESVMALYAKAKKTQDMLNEEIDAVRFYTQLGEPSRVARTK